MPTIDLANDDTCLTEAGYNTSCPDEAIRQAALHKAVASTSLLRVMYRLRYLTNSQCNLNAFRDFNWMTTVAYPLRFQAFGFSMLSTHELRCRAMADAAVVYGLRTVYQRIKLITSRKSAKLHHRAAWAAVVKYLTENDTEAEFITLPSALKQLMLES